MTPVRAPAGFHEFAEFMSEDVGTLDSGLNSMVLANNNEFILMPINEPTFGTPRKSQIQVGGRERGGYSCPSASPPLTRHARARYRWGGGGVLIPNNEPTFGTPY